VKVSGLSQAHALRSDKGSTAVLCAQIRRKLEADYWDTLVGNWYLWVPAQLINFRFVPNKYQVAHTADICCCRSLAFGYLVLCTASLGDGRPGDRLYDVDGGSCPGWLTIGSLCARQVLFSNLVGFVWNNWLSFQSFKAVPSAEA
jgi:hypothetical protein